MKNLICNLLISLLIFGCTSEDEGTPPCEYRSEVSTYNSRLQSYISNPNEATCNELKYAALNLIDAYQECDVSDPNMAEIISFSQMSCEGSGNGKVTFWIAQDFACGSITVNLNGQTRIINQYYSSGITSCDMSGCANFELPPGTYTYSAYCSNQTWNGNVTVTQNGCLLFQLTSSASQTGKATFWTNQNINGGAITVSLNGQSAAVTAYYQNGINSCDMSGCANFNNLPPGTYQYSAYNDSYQWNGSISITANGCSTLLLTP